MSSLSTDYLDRFGGVGRLYGLDNLEQFSSTHCMIVGLGGVGSWTAEALARSGIGALTLIDLDELCITNTNRQLPAHLGNYGSLKVQALKTRILTINPSCCVSSKPVFYSERSSEELLSSSPDLVIDAIDSIHAKCHLLAACRDKQLPIISCGGAGGKKDLTRLKIDDLSRTHGDKLASAVRHTLRSKYGFPAGGERKAKKFHIPTVFSDEPITQPQPCSSDPTQASPHSSRNLNCATGYGAITHVTATFGLTLAQLALEMCEKD